MMAVSRKGAPKIAYDWAHENMWFRGPVQFHSRRLDKETGGYFVEVRYPVTCIVMNLLVVDENDIRVLDDSQGKITLMARELFNDPLEGHYEPQDVHANNVEKLDAAIDGILKEEPDWFLDLVEVDDDACGEDENCDVIVRIACESGNTIDVCIVIVESRAMKADVERSLSEEARARTIILIAGKIREVHSFTTELKGHITRIRRKL